MGLPAMFRFEVFMAWGLKRAAAVGKADRAGMKS